MARSAAQKAASRRNLVSARKARARKGTPTRTTTLSKTIAAKGNSSGGGVTKSIFKEKLSYDTGSSSGRGPIRMSGT